MGLLLIQALQRYQKEQALIDQNFQHINKLLLLAALIIQDLDDLLIVFRKIGNVRSKIL